MSTEGADGDGFREWRPQASAVEGRAIVQLPEEVINKIAAGEVVQRPANAVKELIENSLDAGATRIEITAVNGGLGSLRIEDDGHGIGKADLPLLCQRFATSKLREFDDLQSIGTYGFRGEALASLSMVCRVEVTTRKKGTPETWSAKYRGADMTACQQVPAGLNGQGTVIKASDMFFSMPQRRTMLNKPAEEYRYIVEVATKYAIQYPHCRFSVRKAVAGVPDLSTTPAPDRATCIKRLYSTELFNALIPLSVQDDTTHFYRASLLASKLTYFAVKAEVIVFINGRLVNHDGVVRMVKQLYGPLLPNRAHPFLFIELNVKPQNVDVNAHPTKEKVIFLGEDDILAEIAEALRPLVEQSADASGDLHLKRKLTDAEGSFGLSKPSTQQQGGSGAGAKKQRTADYAHNMVRSDHTMEHGALDKFFSDLSGTGQSKPADAAKQSATALSRVAGGAGGSKSFFKPDATRLASVQQLLADVEGDHDGDLRKALSTSVYVGCANRRHILLQMGVELYLVDLCVLSAELFYQQALLGVGRLPSLRLDPPQDIGALMRLLLDSPSHAYAGITEQGIAAATDTLIRRSAVLDDLFSITITPGGDGTAASVSGIPQVMPEYIPEMHKLPLFLYRLGTCVPYHNEKECIRAVCQELADFYMIDDGSPVERDMEEADLERVLESVSKNGSGGGGGDAGPKPALGLATLNMDEGLLQDVKRLEGTAEAAAASSSGKPQKAPIEVVNCDMSSSEDGGSDSEVPEAVRAGGILSGIAQKKQAEEARLAKGGTAAAAAGGEGGEEAEAGLRASAPATWVLRHVVHPAVKRSLLPPSSWRNSTALQCVASLHLMYKIFERC